MTTIHKFPILIVGEQTIQMQGDAEICNVGLDPQGTPCIWAIVDPKDPLEPLDIFVIGTGSPIPSDALHTGSFVRGEFVWHVFLRP